MLARPNVGSHFLIVGYLIAISIANYMSGLMHIFTKAHCPCSPALLLSACASPPSVQVLDLPPRPVPVAPKEALQPIPPAGHFLTQFREIFKP
jgi:hypothetical protein